MYSKIERGERKAKRSQIPIMAKVFGVDEKELLTVWLADKVLDIVENEDDVKSEAILKRLKKGVSTTLTPFSFSIGNGETMPGECGRGHDVPTQYLGIQTAYGHPGYDGHPFSCP